MEKDTGKSEYTVPQSVPSGQWKKPVKFFGKTTVRKV
jgi:hypothetical protein